MRAPPSAGFSAWLLVRLRLVRLLHVLGTLGRGRAGAPAATRPKRRGSGLLAVVVVACMLLAYGNLALRVVVQLHHAAALAAGESGDVDAAVAHLLTFELSLLVLTAIFMALGSRELSQPDWDMEWLSTLPMRMPALLWARLAERTVANPFGMLALWPTCVAIAWRAGTAVWIAVPLGGLAALPLMGLVALGRTGVDTGLRLRLAPARLRNLQATLSILGLVLFYLCISPGMSAGTRFVGPIAQALPEGAAWSPPGLAVQLLQARDPAAALAALALLWGETLLLLALGVRVLEWLLREGVVAAGARESGRSRAPVVPAAADRRRVGFALKSPVQRRELTLLARDRNFLVQTLVLPLMIVGSQWLLNSSAHSFGQLWDSPVTVAAGAFGVAAYGLMLSAFQTLNTEGGALWLLFTFPCRIEDVLLQKVRLWAVLALAYPAAAFACELVFGPPPGWHLFGLALQVAIGVPIYALIATSLGVFGCDPFAQEARQRVRPTQVYLYTLMSALYVYAIVAGVWWRALVFTVLSALLALALWQKARDELPCLLDPAAGPPPRLSSADGLVAVMLFFVIQGACYAIATAGGAPLEGATVLIAFGIAGAITYVLVRYVHWRTRVPDVPAVFGAGGLRAAAVGLGYGALAAAAGVAWLAVVPHLRLQQVESADMLRPGIWILPLGVLAAPLFEEYIFRGLVFGGLRRSMGRAPAALASAAIFAAMHPPVSMLPVFVLGVLAALAYDRTRLLLAPMLAHGLYNLVVIGIQYRG